MRALYRKLLSTYGPQGWWPLTAVSASGGGSQPTKTGSLQGYHPGDYSYPHTDSERFEICVSAVLTQNTAWPNVEKALLRLISTVGELSPATVMALDEEVLKEAIRPAGYYNQKAAYLRAFAAFYQDIDGRIPTRSELLSVKGVGKETADSILLYAYKVPVFVVDAYTKRILCGLDVIEEDAGYDEVQALFHSWLKKDVVVYQEFHALLVEHAKRWYAKKPYSKNDPLASSTR